MPIDEPPCPIGQGYKFEGIDLKGEIQRPARAIENRFAGHDFPGKRKCPGLPMRLYNPLIRPHKLGRMMSSNSTECNIAGE